MLSKTTTITVSTIAVAPGVGQAWSNIVLYCIPRLVLLPGGWWVLETTALCTWRRYNHP